MQTEARLQRGLAAALGQQLEDESLRLEEQASLEGSVLEQARDEWDAGTKEMAETYQVSLGR